MMQQHICISIVLTLLSACAASTPEITKTGQATPVSIVEMVVLRGARQFISIRGKDIHNPILLFLHGGPGTSVMPLSRKFNGELEDHFVVVNWDQRGAGNSVIEDEDYAHLTIDDFVEDAFALIKHVQTRYGDGCQKVYVMGHSWGSLIGIHLVHKHPEVIQKYFSIGQIVDGTISESRAYEFLLEHITDPGVRKELVLIGPPDHGWYRGGYHAFYRQRELLLEYGGVFYKEKSLNDYMLKVLFSSEYGPSSARRWLRGSRKSLAILWPGIVTRTNLFKEIPTLKAPVVFLAGRHDYNTYYGLIDDYYRFVKAEKKIYWFENSGHAPNYEESERFNQIIISER